MCVCECVCVWACVCVCVRVCVCVCVSVCVCVCVYVYCILCIQFQTVSMNHVDSTTLSGNWHCRYLCLCAFVSKEREPGLMKYENMFHKLKLSDLH